MSVDENIRVVIDNGSVTCKYGFAGDETPREIPTIVSKPNFNEKESLFGEDARNCSQGFTRPMGLSSIVEWDQMEKLWSHIFLNELKINPKEHGVLLTESACNPKANRERMVQVMFESFSVPKAYLAKQAVLALYSNGLTTGIVINSGGGETYAVPIYEGYALPHSIERFSMAGDEITSHFIRELAACHNLTGEIGREIANDIKHKYGYVAENYDDEMKKFSNDPSMMKTYTLPDGKEINIGCCAFQCAEILFRPALAGRECFGLHQVVNKSIMANDGYTRNLWTNIVLSGGSTLFPGLENRLLKELKEEAPTQQKINIKAPANRRFSTWEGGSVLASLHTYREMWISKDKYDEEGPACVHRYCF